VLRGSFLHEVRSYRCGATQGTHQGKSLAAASSERRCAMVVRSSLTLVAAGACSIDRSAPGTGKMVMVELLEGRHSVGSSRAAPQRYGDDRVKLGFHRLKKSSKTMARRLYL
jgi:hypothetical protein